MTSPSWQRRLSYLLIIVGILCIVPVLHRVVVPSHYATAWATLVAIELEVQGTAGIWTPYYEADTRDGTKRPDREIKDGKPVRWANDISGQYVIAELSEAVEVEQQLGPIGKRVVIRYHWCGRNHAEIVPDHKAWLNAKSITQASCLTGIALLIWGIMLSIRGSKLSHEAETEDSG